MDEVTPGLCGCGCGQPTSIAQKSNARRGWVRGQPVRFVSGHARRVIPLSAEAVARISAAHSGESAYNWKGDDVSYGTLHGWLTKHYPKTGTCEECGRGGRTEYALIKGRSYSRNREDYMELCRRCHARYDVGGIQRSAETRVRMGASSRRSWAGARERGTAEQWIVRGEKRAGAKLTDAAVVEIRRARARGVQLQTLAIKYGVSEAAVQKAATGRTWTHVSEPPVR